LFKDNEVHHIPYPIDTDVYKPRHKALLRDMLGLPQEKKLILFVAMNVHDDRKGYKYLLSALQYLETSKNILENTELVVLGSSRPQEDLNKVFKTHYLGKLSDELSLSLIYSACDVFVAPSTQDNLPNTVIESLASGVPVVAFNVGGMPDMIESGKNGFLAELRSSESLARGIMDIFNGDSVQLSNNARKKAIDTFSPQLIAKRYTDLYESIL
jgi:glycosyltransferase involved in cell wall biosynthesis